MCCATTIERAYLVCVWNHIIEGTRYNHRNLLLLVTLYIMIIRLTNLLLGTNYILHLILSTAVPAPSNILFFGHHFTVCTMMFTSSPHSVCVCVVVVHPITSSSDQKLHVVIRSSVKTYSFCMMKSIIAEIDNNLCS